MLPELAQHHAHDIGCKALFADAKIAQLQQRRVLRHLDFPDTPLVLSLERCLQGVKKCAAQINGAPP